MDISSEDESEQSSKEHGLYEDGHPQAATTTAASVEHGKENIAYKNNPDTAVLNEYQLGDCLGKGAFASVYRALNWGTGETVAIKKVRLADLPKSDLRTIMLEIDLLKNLHHPNIVKYHGFKKSSDSLYIILEYCENGSLHSICKNFGKFPENLVALYMSQVLRGLLYLHEQGVIHRDIKGANILTTKEGLVKLADFGVATNAGALNEASVVGTPYWMAPEVIELSGATTASDIWSLGCTVIELLEGKPPYHKLQPMPALFRIVNDDHPPLPESASPSVLDFLMQCFQRDPNLRVSAKKLLKHPWIVTAKRADEVVPVKPTKYDEAVKSVQQWNEALKLPDNPGLAHNPRGLSTSPVGRKWDNGAQSGGTPTPTKGLPERPRNTDSFRSPIEADDDNWDDDFASSIDSSALHLPQLKPIDNFGGLLSSEKLKSYATILPQSNLRMLNADSSKVPNGSYDPLEATLDSLDTVRLPSPIKTTEQIRRFSGLKKVVQRRKDVALNGPPMTTVNKPRIIKRLSSAYREKGVEDFSDLILGDEIALNQRFQQAYTPNEVLSPKFTHVSDLRNAPASSTRIGTTVKPPRREGSIEENPALQRVDSSITIAQYAESVDDEDFSDVFGTDGAIVRHSNHERRSDPAAGTLWVPKFSSSSWPDEDDDDDDPFAKLEEDLDEMDMETKVARDKHVRLGIMVEGLAGSLKTSQSDEFLADLSEQLLQCLLESPDLKSVVISSHGLLPILEVLDNCQRRDISLRLLKIINIIITDSVEIQETLCFVGGIPIITKFAHKKYPSDIRLEAASFVRQMYQTSTLTLQMFISCGGLNVLVDFLEEDYDTERDLVLIGVNGVWSVFELQGPTPKNDFCRIFCRSSALYPLSLVLNRILDEGGELAELAQGRIANIFLIFSQAENHVKEIVADRMVLKRVLKDLRRMSPQHQNTMLKFIKNLSMLATTLDSLQNSNAIEVLIDLLSSNMKMPHFREMSNQILNTMYNLCRLSKTRQEDAALNGIIPLLQRIVQTERPLKEFALPILCDMAHSGKVGRTILWQNKGLHFYISLLADPYWQVTALDAILVWLQEETAKVEEHLLVLSFHTAIVSCFTNSRADTFENLLEPLQKLLRLSPPVAATLAEPELFSRTGQKLYNKKAVVRGNLLRIVRSICDTCDEQDDLLKRYGLYDAIEKLAQGDPAILVRNMAAELVKSSDVLKTSGNTRTAAGGRTGSAEVHRFRQEPNALTRSTSSSVGVTIMTPSIYGAQTASSSSSSLAGPSATTPATRTPARLPYSSSATLLVSEYTTDLSCTREPSRNTPLKARAPVIPSSPATPRPNPQSAKPIRPLTAQSSLSSTTARANALPVRTNRKPPLDTNSLTAVNSQRTITSNRTRDSAPGTPLSVANHTTKSNANGSTSSTAAARSKLQRTNSTSSTTTNDSAGPSTATRARERVARARAGAGTHSPTNPTTGRLENRVDGDSVGPREALRRRRELMSPSAAAGTGRDEGTGTSVGGRTRTVAGTSM